MRSAVRSRVRGMLCCATTAGLTLLLAACELVSFNAFPAFLPYVSAELDLRGTLPDSVRTVRAYTTMTSDGSGFFAFVVEPDGPGEDVLVLVDADLRAVIQRENEPLFFTTSLFTRADDSVQIGNLIYNSATGQVSNGPGPQDTEQSIVDNGGAPVEYFAIRTDNNTQIVLDEYDSAFLPVGSTPAVDAVSTGEDVFEARMHQRFPSLDLNPADAEVLIFVRGVQGIRRTVVTKSALATLGGPVIDAATGVGSQALQADSIESIIETPEGILLVDNTRLLRFSLTTGARLDEFQLGANSRSDEPYAVVFDPGGAFYLVLDTVNRTLYRVEPWW